MPRSSSFWSFYSCTRRFRNIVSETGVFLVTKRVVDNLSETSFSINIRKGIIIIFRERRSVALVAELGIPASRFMTFLNQGIGDDLSKLSSSTYTLLYIFLKSNDELDWFRWIIIFYKLKKASQWFINKLSSLSSYEKSFLGFISSKSINELRIV